MQTPVTRFAPSPTGHLHIGGARTALFSWAFARGRGGGFVLRIEDTDQKRSSDDATRGILEDLRWLAIDWDRGPDAPNEQTDTGGPFYQSQRLEIYDRFIAQLVDADLAYPAFDTSEELDAMRAEAKAAKRTFRYVRAPGYDRAAAMERMQREQHVVRFRMPPEAITVHDVVLGEVTTSADELDDFVIRKADGFPTYHLAVVVDDELMGVTHVLRGQEHLNNTPRHVALQRALKRDDGTPFRTPAYAHMPLIFNPDGSKMSKRDKDKALKAVVRDLGGVAKAMEHPGRGAITADEASLEAWLGDKTAQLPTDALDGLARAFNVDLPEINVEDFRAAGYLPEVVCNYIALLGWQKGSDVERFTIAEFVERFDLDQIGKTAAKFDREKLLAFNFDTMRELGVEALAARWREWCARYDEALPAQLGERFELAAKMAQPRAKTLRQLREPIAFTLLADDAIEYDEKAVQKSLLKNDGAGLALLGELRTMLGELDDWSPEALDAACAAFAETRGVGMGQVAQPLRVAVTGAGVSPGLGETLALLGYKRAVARIDRCATLANE